MTCALGPGLGPLLPERNMFVDWPQRAQTGLPLRIILAAKAVDRELYRELIYMLFPRKVGFGAILDIF